MRPIEPPRAPKRKSRDPRPNVSKKPEMPEVKIVLPPGRGHDFRCQGRSEGRAYVRVIFGARMASLEIPWALRSAHKTLTMKNRFVLKQLIASRLVSSRSNLFGLVVSHPVHLPREDFELPSPPVGRQKQQYSCDNNRMFEKSTFEMRMLFEHRFGAPWST